MSDTKPTTNPAKTTKRGSKTYQLFANGELWTTGGGGYLCGHVMDPENIEDAIDAHEAEVEYMLALVRSEFGF